jgi:hypothetical protein
MDMVQISKFCTYSTVPIIRPKHEQHMVELTKTSDNQNQVEEGLKQMANLLKVQCKYKMRFINNYSTVQLT